MSSQGVCRKKVQGRDLSNCTTSIIPLSFDSKDINSKSHTSRDKIKFYSNSLSTAITVNPSSDLKTFPWLDFFGIARIDSSRIYKVFHRPDRIKFVVGGGYFFVTTYISLTSVVLV